MPIIIEDRGFNNSVTAPNVGDGRIVIDGSNNNVVINGPFMGSLHMRLGNKSSVAVGSGCSFLATTMHLQDGGKLVIGDRVSTNIRVQFLIHEAACIEVGAWCLFASDINVSVSDMHSIFDRSSRNRINPARDIVIGEHVWVGSRAYIMKGATIGSGSVIGAGSIVTGELPSNCIAVGQPARIIREGVLWDRRISDQLPEDAPALLYADNI